MSPQQNVATLRHPALTDSIQVIEHTARDMPKELRDFVVEFYQARLLEGYQI